MFGRFSLPALLFIPCLIFGLLLGTPPAVSKIIYSDNLSVKFTWTAATGNPEFYNVYVSDDGAEFVLVGTTPTTSYILTGKEGHTYKVKVQAADSRGNVGPMSDESVPVTFMPQKRHFTLHLSKGINFVSVPLKDKRITRLSDFANLMGQEKVSMVIYYDDESRFSAWFPANPSINNVDVLGDRSYLVIMKEETSVTLEGMAWEGKVALDKGINLSAVPVNILNIERLSDLAAFIGLDRMTLIIYYDEMQKKFVFWSPSHGADLPTDIEIKGGIGYMLMMKEEVEQLIFVGEAWENTFATPEMPTAPHLSSATSTPIMGIMGSVVDADRNTPLDGIEIIVTNGTVKSENGLFKQDTGSTGNTGQFTVVLTDIFGRNPIKAGDVLSITACYPNSTLNSKTIHHTITDEDIQLSTITLPPILLPRLPAKTELLANYPNPFNPETWIPFKLSQNAPVMVKIYNAKGELVKTLDLGQIQAGNYLSKEKAAHWNGRNAFGEQVASNVYFYTIKAGNFTATRKMILVK